MGRRKNAAPPPITSSEKPKERNRSSFMPFRRGDSSRSQPDSEAISVTSRSMVPTISEETNRPTSSMRRPETAKRPSARSENAGQERTYMGSALVNGTASTQSDVNVNVTGTSASVNQAVTTNTVALDQVYSVLNFLRVFLLTVISHYTSSVSHHHLLSGTWMSSLVLSKTPQRTMRESRPLLVIISH